MLFVFGVIVFYFRRLFAEGRTVDSVVSRLLVVVFLGSRGRFLCGFRKFRSFSLLVSRFGDIGIMFSYCEVEESKIVLGCRGDIFLNCLFFGISCIECWSCDRGYECLRRVIFIGLIVIY